MMNSYITKDGKKLRLGYTTGSCAAAAAKAAALMLLTGSRLDSVYLMTPGGRGLRLSLSDITISDGRVSCGVVKDSGDDPDVTDGMTIYAEVKKTDNNGIISIDGGEGIGRVTKPGLDQPVGAAAINSTPRRMISDALAAVCEDSGYSGGLSVTVYAPEGAAIAEKTFNPRLGIVGGISILGTTGIVEPMSDEAVIETVRAELSVRRAQGKSYVLLTPGNYGAAFIKNELSIDPAAAVTTSNFIGDAFAMAVEAGFAGALIVGHIGKLVKLAGNIFNTHSRYGDCRAEIIAAHAGMRGASAEVIRMIMDSASTDDMLSILDGVNLADDVAASIMKKLEDNLKLRVGGMSAGAICFSNTRGLIGATEKAEELLRKIREEN